MITLFLLLLVGSVVIPYICGDVPTNIPTSYPTSFPTGRPTSKPITSSPTKTQLPTGTPTSQPSTPTLLPTEEPTAPSFSPSVAPSRPTRTPTQVPTIRPSQPSPSPSRTPTKLPSFRPTPIPSISFTPTFMPTRIPTRVPTWSQAPTVTPTFKPTALPTGQPTSQPSQNYWDVIGVQHNYPLSSLNDNLLQQECDLCYSAAYSAVTPSTISTTCKDGEFVFIGALESPSSTVALLGAFGRTSEVFKSNTALTPNYHRSVYWYYEAGNSMGFASTLDITRDGDKSTTSSSDRLSWMIDNLQGGYRAGSNTDLYTSDTYQKVIYTCGRSPTGQPTSQPSPNPTPSPTKIPTRVPTVTPTKVPSVTPTVVPTRPTFSPTLKPTRRPTGQPTGQPSRQPSSQPTGQPTSNRFSYNGKFYVQALYSTPYQVVEGVNVIGDYYGGVAVSSSSVFFTGHDYTGIYPLGSLSSVTSVITRMDSLVTNLNGNAVYTLQGSSGLTLSSAGYVYSLGLLNSVGGVETSDSNTTITLSSAVYLSDKSYVFSGYDRIVLVNSGDSSAYNVDLLTGEVITMGSVTKSRIMSTDNWLSYGIAESLTSGVETILYGSKSSTIERQPICPLSSCAGVSGYSTETVFTLTSTSGAIGSISIDLLDSKWYFTYTGRSGWTSTNVYTAIGWSTGKFYFNEQPTGQPTQSPSKSLVSHSPTLQPTNALVFYDQGTTYYSDYYDSSNGAVSFLKYHIVGDYCGTYNALNAFQLGVASSDYTSNPNIRYSYSCSVDAQVTPTQSGSKTSSLFSNSGIENMANVAVTCPTGYVINRFQLICSSSTSMCYFRFFCYSYGTLLCSTYTSSSVTVESSVNTKSYYLSSISPNCASVSNTAMQGFTLQQSSNSFYYTYQCCSLVGPTSAPTSQPSSQPSRLPSGQPSRQPSRQPTAQPSRQPTGQPSRQPTSKPTMQPTGQPSRKPSGQPSRQPTRQPTGQPSRSPSGQPTRQPTGQPTGQPSRKPSGQPSRQPSSRPSRQPTSRPTGQPSRQPSRQPTGQPSVVPTAQPSIIPTQIPSMRPSGQPTSNPTSPTGQPSSMPSSDPTMQPTGKPSGQPTRQPTSKPSMQPSSRPTGVPSGQPSSSPTAMPSNTEMIVIQISVVQVLDGINSTIFKSNGLNAILFQEAIAGTIGNGVSTADIVLTVIEDKVAYRGLLRYTSIYDYIGKINSTVHRQLLVTSTLIEYLVNLPITKLGIASANSGYNLVLDNLGNSTKFDAVLNRLVTANGGTNLANAVTASVTFGSYSVLYQRSYYPTSVPTLGPPPPKTYTTIIVTTIIVPGCAITLVLLYLMYRYPHRFKCIQYTRKPDQIGKTLHFDAQKSKDKLAKAHINLEDLLNKDLKLLHLKKGTHREEMLHSSDNNNVHTFFNFLADGQQLEEDFIKFRQHQSHRIEIDDDDQELKENDDDFVYADDTLVRI